MPSWDTMELKVGRIKSYDHCLSQGIIKKAKSLKSKTKNKRKRKKKKENKKMHSLLDKLLVVI